MLRNLLRVMREDRRGFTLIELLVVVAIIGILATVAIPKVTGAIDQARSKKSQADLSTIEQALERFYSDQGFYPVNLDWLQTPLNNVDPYLKKDVSFKNAYGKVYFYAIRYDGTGDKDNYQGFVLADPGKQGGTDWTWWTDTTKAKNPHEGLGVTTSYAYGDPSGADITTVDNPKDIEGNTWTVPASTLTATTQIGHPTRDDVKTD